jgi:hypothetical protein
MRNMCKMVGLVEEIRKLGGWLYKGEPSESVEAQD